MTALYAHFTVKCDRCKKIIDGCWSPGFTGGYYTFDGWWEFMNKNERTLCDSCMWKDPRYIKVYGKQS